RADPRLGYDFTHVAIDSDDPAVPNRLSDQSIAFGMGVASIDGWLAGASIGVGYAAVNPYADAQGNYFKADFAIGKAFDENNQLGIVLSYDGSRTFMPDVPLIGVQYRRVLDPKLTAAVGFPINTLTWRPTDRLTVDVRYTFPESLDANVRYQVSDEWEVFASLGSRHKRYAWDE